MKGQKNAMPMTINACCFKGVAPMVVVGWRVCAGLKTFYSYLRWYMPFHTKYVKTGEPFGGTFMPLSETPESCEMRFLPHRCAGAAPCMRNGSSRFTQDASGELACVH